MRKCFVFLLILMLSGFIIAVETPAGMDEAEERAEKAEELIEQVRDYDVFVTKAEERIRNANVWLGENVGWMRYIFHMKPAISLLFFINVYIILWFFVVLFLNAEGLWFFIEDKGKARIFGGAVFFILLVVRLYYGLAVVLDGWVHYFWHAVLPAGLLGIVILFALIGFLAAFFLPAAVAILNAFKKTMAAKKAMKERMRTAANNEAMEALINQVGQQQ